MTYAVDEASVEGSLPLEGYVIELPMITYYLATGDRAFTIAGQGYTPGTISRSAQVITNTAESREMIVYMPVSHPVVQRYILQAMPPQNVRVTIYRMQETSGEFRRVWRGLVTSCSIDGSNAQLRIPATTDDKMQVRLPTVSASRSCPHVLYDSNCKIVRNIGSTQTNSTVISIGTDPRVIVVGSMGGFPDEWSRLGEVKHPISKERRVVLDQVGTVITMQTYIPELKVGDAVEIYKGCDKTLDTCRVIFGNTANFGGLPDLPAKDPFKPGNGLGVIQS